MNRTRGVGQQTVPRAMHCADATQIAQPSEWQFVELTFGGRRFHAQLLAKEYAALADVTTSVLDTYAYDGPPEPEPGWLTALGDCRSRL